MEPFLSRDTSGYRQAAAAATQAVVVEAVTQAVVRKEAVETRMEEEENDGLDEEVVETRMEEEEKDELEEEKMEGDVACCCCQERSEGCVEQAHVYQVCFA